MIVPSDSDERVAAAVADRDREHRLLALERAHGWQRRALAAVAAVAIGALGSVASRIWTAAETTTTERVQLHRALDDIREIRDEVRMLRSSTKPFEPQRTP
jgi:hypothetical protein